MRVADRPPLYRIPGNARSSICPFIPVVVAARRVKRSLDWPERAARRHGSRVDPDLASRWRPEHPIRTQSGPSAPERPVITGTPGTPARPPARPAQRALRFPGLCTLMTVGTMRRRNAGTRAPRLPRALTGHEKKAVVITCSLNETNFVFEEFSCEQAGKPISGEGSRSRSRQHTPRAMSRPSATTGKPPTTTSGTPPWATPRPPRTISRPWPRSCSSSSWSPRVETVALLDVDEADPVYVTRRDSFIGLELSYDS